MCRKLIYLVSFSPCWRTVAAGVLVLAVATGITNADIGKGLIGYWKFDESSGITAADTAGRDNDGTLSTEVSWTAGKIRGGLFYSGPSTAHVEVPTTGMSASAGTVAMWGYLSAPQPPQTRYFFGHTTQPSYANRIQLYMDGGNTELDLGLGDSHARRTAIMILQTQRWYHVAVTWDNGNYVVYVDGEAMAQGTYTGLTTLHTFAWIGNDGNPVSEGTEAFGGVLDEVRIYNRALTQKEIQETMIGIPPGVASNPIPADEAIDVQREVVLNWKPGEYAPPVNGHKVYLSDNFSDVNDGIGGVTQDANSYTPGRLNLSTTYYWRVDEVNGPPDYTVHKGDVWSFTTELIAYPIENITATASSQSANRGPENTINGSGLDDTGLLHDKVGDGNMWLSGVAGPQPTWIEFEFDKVYKLYEMWVWNSNETMEPVIGFGFKDVTIEYSVNGTDFTTLGTTHQFARAPGTPGYAHNTTVDMGGVAAKYVKLTANSNWGGILAQYGLSEVRFLYIPVLASEPKPDSGATGVSIGTIDAPADMTLSFRAGREAAKHNVYFSADQQAVIDGTAPVATVTKASYGPLSLNLGKTYYWRVDEVNEAQTPATWQGDLWNFRTQEYYVVDDFESYNDLDTTDPKSNRIFLSWIDGYGTTTNGSIVGYENPPFAEKTIVHGDKQSMPFSYSNTAGKTYSEAERTFAVPQNWNVSGVKTLALFFCGASGNTGQLYVKINGAKKVTYDGDASNLSLTGWQAWNIDLASVGVNLQRITKLAVGIDGNGAAGKLYFDDIRLYPYTRVLITPSEPDSTRLMGNWKFDGSLNDSSGKGRNGSGVGNPTFEAGKIGQAVTLSGSNYVVITGYKGILGGNAFSIAAWVKSTSTGDVTMVNWGTQLGGQRVDFRLYQGRLRIEHGNGNLQGNTVLADGQWHHVALTVTENAPLSYPSVKLYLDGMDDSQTTTDPDTFNIVANIDVNIGRRGTNNDRVFPGSLDEVRIYDRVLTQEEIAWLAGKTKPYDKPF